MQVAMQDLTVTALVDALEASLSQSWPEPPLLAFDADGTLWTGDVGDDFLETMIGRRAIREEARSSLERDSAAISWRVGDLNEAAQALYAAHREGRFDEERFYELVAWIGAGHTRAELAAFADEMHRERSLDARLHHEVAPVLAWARKRGVEVFVVSASPRIVVERGVARLGVASDHVLAAEAEFDADVMVAAARRPIPYGAGKVAALRHRVGSRTLLAAFGDNVFDVAMLNEARIPVAVRPKPRLIAAAAQIDGCRRLVAPAQG